MGYLSIPQLPGSAGVWQTVTIMRNMVNKNYTHQWIRDRAATITQHCGMHNTHCKINSIWAWVRMAVPFVKDPIDVEALHDPVTWMEARLRRGLPVYGDCDDLAMYAATLAKAIGIPVSFEVAGNAARYFHIYTVMDGVKVDPTLSGGDTLRGITRTWTFDI